MITFLRRLACLLIFLLPSTGRGSKRILVGRHHHLLDLKRDIEVNQFEALGVPFLDVVLATDDWEGLRHQQRVRGIQLDNVFDGRLDESVAVRLQDLLNLFDILLGCVTSDRSFDSRLLLTARWLHRSLEFVCHCVKFLTCGDEYCREVMALVCYLCYLQASPLHVMSLRNIGTA